jgi:predicted CXXCH cytochrome family protein
MLRAAETSTAAAGHGGSLDAASRLCLDCHPRHADWGQPPGYRRHPVGLPVSSERVRRNAELPLPLADVEGEDGAARRVLACTTCHEVHRSSHENLLRWDQQQFVSACTTCHPKDAGRRPQPEVTTLRTPRQR